MHSNDRARVRVDNRKTLLLTVLPPSPFQHFKSPRTQQMPGRPVWDGLKTLVSKGSTAIPGSHLFSIGVGMKGLCSACAAPKYAFPL